MTDVEGASHWRRDAWKVSLRGAGVNATGPAGP
ncbi:MAG: hypothetical protein RLZZ21_481 [Planctomycetota bacterium]|jgi:hypothetical protein